MNEYIYEQYRRKPVTQDEIQREYKSARKNILQANRGLKFKVQFDGWNIIPSPFGLTLQVCYLDGDNQYQTYKVTL